MWDFLYWYSPGKDYISFVRVDPVNEICSMLGESQNLWYLWRCNLNFQQPLRQQCRQESFLLVFPELIWPEPAKDHFLVSSFFTSFARAAQGAKRTNLWSMCVCRATVSMGSWEYSGSTHTTGVLLWVDTVSSVWAGQGYWGGRGRIPSDVEAAGMYWAPCLGMDSEANDGLCVRMRRKTKPHDVVVGACNGLPHHKWRANDAIFRQLEETSYLQLQGTWAMLSLLEGQEGKTQVNWEISRVKENFLTFFWRCPCWQQEFPVGR